MALSSSDQRYQRRLLSAIVSIIIPGRIAIVLPVLFIAPVLLVAIFVFLLSPGLLLLEVLLGSQSCIVWRRICCGYIPSADCASRNLVSRS